MGASDLLLVIDGSRDNRAAIADATTLLQRRPGARVGLLSLLPSFPPELLEFGGAEDPGDEERLERELQRRREEWLIAAKRGAQPVVERAVAALQAAGAAAGAIDAWFCEAAAHPHTADSLADEILAFAHARGYGMLLVRRGLETATGEDLAARAGDLTVSLVE